jgi:hypothetical protein
VDPVWLKRFPSVSCSGERGRVLEGGWEKVVGTGVRVAKEDGIEFWLLKDMTGCI